MAKAQRHIANAAEIKVAAEPDESQITMAKPLCEETDTGAAYIGRSKRLGSSRSNRVVDVIFEAVLAIRRRLDGLTPPRPSHVDFTSVCQPSALANTELSIRICRSAVGR
jgi:hypothetical protein